MTRAGPRPVLVTGATGRIGRVVVALLREAGVRVRALTRHPETATSPAGVDVVGGDLTVPESLDAALRGVDTAFLVWTAPPATVPAVVERVAAHAQRVVLLSSPHRTPHPFFRQPNPTAVLHADIERLIAASGLGSTIIRRTPAATTSSPAPSRSARPSRCASSARCWGCPPRSRS